MKIMKSLFIWMLLTPLVLHATASHGIRSHRDLPSVGKNATIGEAWEFYGDILNFTLNSVLDDFLPGVDQALWNLTAVSAECKTDLLKLALGLREMKSWAFRFLDSSGKNVFSLLNGGFSAFGSYEECLDTVVQQGRGRGSVEFRGQYCSIDLKPVLPPKPDYYTLDNTVPEILKVLDNKTVLWRIGFGATLFYIEPYRLGVCLPSSCSLESLNQAAQIVGKKFGVEISASRCDVKKDNKLNAVQISVLCFYSFTVGLMVIGTVFDWFEQNTILESESKMVQCFRAFSIVKNFKKLIKVDKNTGTLRCFFGIRFFSMTWIMLGHTYLLINKRMFYDMTKIGSQLKTTAFQVFTNAPLGVDTFFFMGGVLVSYGITNLVKKEQKTLNVLVIVLRRLWRIVPIYVYTIVSFFLIDRIGSGPVWEEMAGHYIRDCYDNWWANLLFVNNWIDAYHMCVPTSWYLSIDFQMFLVALLVTVALLKNEKVGIILAVLLIVASVITSGVLTYMMKFPPTMLFIAPDDGLFMNYWAKFHFQPYPHLAPYFTGYLTGYLLAVKPGLKIGKETLVAVWILAMGISSAVVFGIYPWNAGKDTTTLETVAHAAFHRLGWSLFLAWMIVCCCTGYGGIINQILSWKVFVPMGRLTFAAYLIHPIVILTFGSSLRVHVQSEVFLIIWFLLGHLSVSYGLAFVASLLFEAPMMSLEKIFFNNVEKKTNNEVNVSNSKLQDEKFNAIKFSKFNDKNASIAYGSPSLVTRCTTLHM